MQQLAALSAGATSALLLVVLAGRHLGVGPGGFGLLAAIGVGAALGPLLLARLVSNPRRPAWVFGPLLLRGLVDLVLATIRSLAVAMGALAVYGVGPRRARAGEPHCGPHTALNLGSRPLTPSHRPAR